MLITGGGGQLGAELMATASAAGHVVRSTTRADCDITDPEQVARVVHEASPDVVVNCAAWTKVDAAETEADSAFRVNALGPRVLAGACQRRGLLLVQLSTDYVFNGSGAAPIDEWQVPDPQSVYGASKLAGEHEVRTATDRHQIVRTSWLYGATGPNFVLTMLRLAARGTPLRVVADQLGGPTWTGHLAPALLRVIERDLPGTYHLSNAGAVSWHGLAEAVFAAAGMAVEATPISTAEYPTAAPRPAYSVLDNRVWRLLGEPSLPDWQDGVRAYIGELRGRGALGG